VATPAEIYKDKYKLDLDHFNLNNINFSLVCISKILDIIIVWSEGSIACDYGLQNLENKYNLIF
jgi:hypothetical protein